MTIAPGSQLFSIDEPLAMLRSSATSYYHADGLGSVTSLSNSSGSIAQTYTFDSFGNQTASSGSLTNPFRYTAREFDSETSLYHYRARYYDSSVGRFISEDPIAFKGEINFYRYGHNGPVDNSDPLGLTTYNGFPADLEVEMRNAVNEALSKLRSHCRYSSCNGVDGPKVADALEKATFIYKPKQKDCGLAGPFSYKIRIHHQVGIGPAAFTPACCSLASTVAHEAVHLTGGNDDKAYDLEEKCFGCKRPVKQ